MDLNGATGDDLLHKKLEIALPFWKPLDQMKEVERKAKCLEVFVQKTQSAVDTYLTLIEMVEFNAYPRYYKLDYKPTNPEAIKTLEKLLKKLKAGIDGQTSVWKPEEAADILLTRDVVFTREFKLLKGQTQLDTKIMVTYDQLLPFHNKNWTANENCVPVKDLPKFYKIKGRLW